METQTQQLAPVLDAHPVPRTAQCLHPPAKSHRSTLRHAHGQEPLQHGPGPPAAHGTRTGNAHRERPGRRGCRAAPAAAQSVRKQLPGRRGRPTCPWSPPPRGRSSGPRTPPRPQLRSRRRRSVCAGAWGSRAACSGRCASPGWWWSPASRSGTTGTGGCPSGARTTRRTSPRSDGDRSVSAPPATSRRPRSARRRPPGSRSGRRVRSGARPCRPGSQSARRSLACSRRGSPARS
jgi:hypothetical protein